MKNEMIKIDREKNRLYLYFSTITEIADCRCMITEIESIVRLLKQGFSCISDLRGFSYHDHDFMQSIQETLWDAGVKLVVRIIEPDQNEKILFTHEKKSIVWPAYLIETAHNIEHAEIILKTYNL